MPKEPKARDKIEHQAKKTLEPGEETNYSPCGTQKNLHYAPKSEFVNPKKPAHRLKHRRQGHHLHDVLFVDAPRTQGQKEEKKPTTPLAIPKRNYTMRRRVILSTKNSPSPATPSSDTGPEPSTSTSPSALPRVANLVPGIPPNTDPSAITTAHVLNLLLRALLDPQPPTWYQIMDAPHDTSSEEGRNKLITLLDNVRADADYKTQRLRWVGSVWEWTLSPTSHPRVVLPSALTSSPAPPAVAPTISMADIAGRLKRKEPSSESLSGDSPRKRSKRARVDVEKYEGEDGEEYGEEYEEEPTAAGSSKGKATSTDRRYGRR
ncbi:hypothetical protein K438DRAFT_1758126 [Mycena galopus ATCC 62051]|nr:hypothetical protein K438DRAFT_1758126 [Mycena galopus ATCC 62051]